MLARRGTNFELIRTQEAIKMLEGDDDEEDEDDEGRWYGGITACPVLLDPIRGNGTLLKMGCYYSTRMCH